MGFEFVSGRPATEREEFLLELANSLNDFRAAKIGVFAVLPNGETFQGYYRMEFGDKLLMSGHVQMDALDEMLRNNRQRYFCEEDEDEEPEI